MGYGHLHCLARCFFLPHVQLQGCPPNPSLSRTPQIEKAFQNVADDMYIPHHWKNMWLAVAVMVWKRPTKEAPIHLILLGRCPIISHYIPLQVLKPHCNRHSVPLVSHHLPIISPWIRLRVEPARSQIALLKFPFVVCWILNFPIHFHLFGFYSLLYLSIYLSMHLFIYLLMYMLYIYIPMSIQKR